MEFGFIGLGNMGGGLAKNLIRAGKKDAFGYFREASEAGFGGEDCNAVYKVIK
jgi:pyrroline-5-carboxylate reductase